MGNVLEYQGPIQRGQMLGLREVLGSPFLVRRKLASRGAYVVVQCRCGDVDVVRVDAAGICCRSCKNVSKTRDGQSRLRIYQTWVGMIHRCEKVKHGDGFRYYRGRGIRVCSGWLNSFEEFKKWAIANGYSDDLTIERKDVNGNYEPANCCWVSMKSQANNRRNTIRLTAFGCTRTIDEWRSKNINGLGLSYQIIVRRFYEGWSHERILSTKPGRYRTPLFSSSTD